MMFKSSMLPSFNSFDQFQKVGLEEFLGSEQDTMFASRASSCMLGATLKDEAPEEEEVGLLGRDGWTGLFYLHWYPVDENSTKSLNPACRDVGAKVRLMSKEKS